MDILDAVFVYQMRSRTELRWHGRTHAHAEREYEIHYFLGGHGEFANGSTCYAINPGTLFVSAPGTVHAIKAQADDPITYYAILVRLEAREHDLAGMLAEQEQQSPFPIGTNYRFFFEEVKEKGLSRSARRRQSAEHQLCSLLYLLGDGAEVPVNDSESRHLERSLRIMQKHVMGSLTLSELAEELGLTQSYFIRVFSRRMRQSPMKYYMRLKIEAASALLTCTELSVKEIAAKLGFSSEFHFSKQFKLKTGMAPIYYRRDYLQTLDVASVGSEDQ